MIRVRNSRIGGGVVSVGTTVARIAIASFGRLSAPMTTASGRASRRWVARHAKTRLRIDRRARKTVWRRPRAPLILTSRWDLPKGIVEALAFR
jgi:hypothetical protein